MKKVLHCSVLVPKRDIKSNISNSFAERVLQLFSKYLFPACFQLPVPFCPPFEMMKYPGFQLVKASRIANVVPVRLSEIRPRV
jgi:hypothetical protein